MKFREAVDRLMDEYMQAGATKEEAFVLCTCVTAAFINNVPRDVDGSLATLRKAQSIFRDTYGRSSPFIDAAMKERLQ